MGRFKVNSNTCIFSIARIRSADNAGSTSDPARCHQSHPFCLRGREGVDGGWSPTSVWAGTLKSRGGKRSGGRAETTGSRLCAGGNSSRLMGATAGSRASRSPR
jgi:hypothetical protein